MHQLSFVYQCIFGFPQTHLKCTEKINSYRVTLHGSLFCVSSSNDVCINYLISSPARCGLQLHMLTFLKVEVKDRNSQLLKVHTGLSTTSQSL